MNAVLAFFAGPIGRWVVVAALMLSAIGAAELHGRMAEHDHDMVVLEKQRKADEAEAAKVAAEKQRRVDEADAKFRAQVAADEARLKGQLARALSQLEQAKKEAGGYVGDSNSRVCPSVTVGYLVFRARVSDIANGRDPATAIPAPDVAAAAAGVPLSDIAIGLDAPQASAYATCRERDTAWAQHVDRLEAWAAEVINLTGRKQP